MVSQPATYPTEPTSRPATPRGSPASIEAAPAAPPVAAAPKAARTRKKPTRRRPELPVAELEHQDVDVAPASFLRGFATGGHTARSTDDRGFLQGFFGGG